MKLIFKFQVFEKLTDIISNTSEFCNPIAGQCQDRFAIMRLECTRGHQEEELPGDRYQK
jgi:hypothetical protein